MLLRVLRCCAELARNQWLKPQKLRQLQEQRLKMLLNHAYEKVPLYHHKFQAAGIKPEEVKSIDDLRKVPFTTKREIWDGVPDQSIAKGYNVNDSILVFTSGTTGGPMPAYYDKRFYDYLLAERFYRAPRARGFNPWDRTMRIGYHVPSPDPKRNAASSRPSRGRDALGPLFALFKQWQKRVYMAYSGDEIIQDLLDYQPKILGGTPSRLRLVAEAVAEKSIGDLHLKAVQSSGEVLDEPTRQFLESFFGCNVFNSYGTNETGSVACECMKQEGLHILSDLVIVETVQNNETVDLGEPGELVVTGLINYAMPLIRYRMGDVGILAEAPCSCGRGFPLLHSIEGRLVDHLRLPGGQTVSPKAIMTAVQGTPGVSRYRVVQEHRNRVRIELMRRPSEPDVSIDALLARCQQVFGDAVAIEVGVNNREHLRAKFRPVISKLTVDIEPRWTEPYNRILVNTDQSSLR